MSPFFDAPIHVPAELICGAKPLAPPLDPAAAIRYSELCLVHATLIPAILGFYSSHRRVEAKGELKGRL